MLGLDLINSAAVCSVIRADGNDGIPSGGGEESAGGSEVQRGDRRVPAAREESRRGLCPCCEARLSVEKSLALWISNPSAVTPSQFEGGASLSSTNLVLRSRPSSELNGPGQSPAHSRNTSASQKQRRFSDHGDTLS